MFDKHDIWHFLSGAGLLTVFLILLVIDDGIAEVPYDKIPTFWILSRMNDIYNIQITNGEHQFLDLTSDDEYCPLNSLISLWYACATTSKIDDTFPTPAS